MQHGSFLQQLIISQNPQKSKSEKIGSALFLVLALGATIASGVTGYNVPLLDSFELLGDVGGQMAAYSIFGFNNASWMGEFGLLCGSQGNNRRPQNEKNALLLGGAVGTAVGITLFLKAPLLLTALGSYGIVPTALIAGAAASVVGTGGIVLGAVVAALAVASVCKSCADYAAKAYNYYQYKSENADPKLHQHVKQHEKEYKGASYGVIGGILLGAIGAALLVPALPIIGIVAGIGASALIVGAAIATCSSLVAKTFKYLPAWMNSDTEKAEAAPKPIRSNNRSTPQTKKLKADSFARALKNLLSVSTPKSRSIASEPGVSAVNMTSLAKKQHTSSYNLRAINDHAIVCAGIRSVKKLQQLETGCLAALEMENTSSVVRQISMLAY